MIEISVHVLSDLRRRQTIQGPCSPSLSEHSWAMCSYDEQIVAIICVRCGRYPLEIMSLWEIRT
jgi:hypothetical protein